MLKDSETNKTSVEGSVGTHRGEGVTARIHSFRWDCGLFNAGCVVFRVLFLSTAAVHGHDRYFLHGSSLGNFLRPKTSLKRDFVSLLPQIF